MELQGFNKPLDCLSSPILPQKDSKQRQLTNYEQENIWQIYDLK